MVWITRKMSGKMESIVSINNSSLCNKFCQKMRRNKRFVCNKCYSNRLLGARKGAAAKFEENSKLLSEKLLEKKDIPILNVMYVRFNAFGELINTTHLRNLYNIAKRNPKVNFALWTKRKDLILEVVPIPDNVILVYSEPELNPVGLDIPTLFDKVFAVYTKEFAEANDIEINCSKKCFRCLKCYSRRKRDVFIRELLK